MALDDGGANSAAENSNEHVWKTSDLSSSLRSKSGHGRQIDSSSSLSASSQGSFGRASLRRGMILPFQPYSISFKGISYSVDMPKEYRERGATEDRLQILHDITGAFRPGILTALVGVTGAGKSTLMDVLSGRKTRGYVDGDIRINGFPKKQETFTRIAAYCEQNDIHSPQLTVHESVLFSAWLRLQADVPSQTRLDFAMEIITLVELAALKDALVGVPGQSGLSTEQRKRVTIAVELVANPSIIFMDEPTTGLDARSAATVMRAVRNTVDTGRTVVCTIHQPSIDIFESFDELLLLKQGGQSIYVGPLGRHSHHLIKYFQSNANAPEIKNGQNPAAWMLDITTPGMEQKLGVDFSEIYRNSSTCRDIEDLVEKLSVPAPDAEDISFSTIFAQPLGMQFMACLWKQHWTYWRSPGFNLMRFGLAISFGVFCGTLYWGFGRKLDTERNLYSLMGTLNNSLGFYGVLTAIAIQPIINAERVVLYRERGAGMYSETAYALSQCVIEIPYVLVSSTTFHVLQYSMMRLEWNAAKFFWVWYFTFCGQILFTFLGMLTVALSPNAEVGAVLLSFMLQMWSLFTGFVLPLPQIPVWWKWFYWCDPQAALLNGVITAICGHMDDQLLTTRTGAILSVKDFIREAYSYKHEYLKLLGPLTALFPFLFAVGYVVCLKVLNYQQR